MYGDSYEEDVDNLIENSGCKANDYEEMPEDEAEYLLDMWYIKVIPFQIMGWIAAFCAVFIIFYIVHLKFERTRIDLYEWTSYIFGIIAFTVYAGFFIPYNQSYYYDCKKIMGYMVNLDWLFDFNYEMIVLQKIMYNAHIIYKIAKNKELP